MIAELLDNLTMHLVLQKEALQLYPLCHLPLPCCPVQHYL
jgi:hypothetical protein